MNSCKITPRRVTKSCHAQSQCKILTEPSLSAGSEKCDQLHITVHNGLSGDHIHSFSQLYPNVLAITGNIIALNVESLVSMYIKVLSAKSYNTETFLKKVPSISYYHIIDIRI